MKRKEMEMTFNQGNKLIEIELERAKKCRNKIIQLLAEIGGEYQKNMFRFQTLLRLFLQLNIKNENANAYWIMH